MTTKIRTILSGTSLTEKEFDKCTKELCDLLNVVVSSSLKDDRNRIWEQLLVEENETAFSSKIEAYTDDVYNIIFKNGEIKP